MSFVTIFLVLEEGNEKIDKENKNIVLFSLQRKEEERVKVRENKKVFLEGNLIFKEVIVSIVLN